MKTGRTAPDICKTPNLCRTLNICKVLNICKILLPLDGCSRMYKVSKVRKDKASGPVLDAEEVTILLSLNAKA